MKHKALFFIALYFTSFFIKAQFDHPGILYNRYDLEFVKSKIDNKQEPWLSNFNLLKKSKFASIDWQPSLIDTINVGFGGKPRIGAKEFYDDGDAAYSMALLWYFTRDNCYLTKSISIINSWSYTLKVVLNKNRKLVIGVGSIKFLLAAEIVKHTSNEWHISDQRQFERVVSDIWLSTIESYQPDYNGNWDAAIIQTIMSIAIYLDDMPLFTSTCNYYLFGKSKGSIKNYISETGQCQESGRDQTHVQMGLGYLSVACAIAWKQGVDLYSAYNNRLAKGFEYTAKYMLGDEVDYVPFKTPYNGETLFGDEISKKGRGIFQPVYVRVYNHYRGRTPLKMTNVEKTIRENGPETKGGVFIPWSSLMSSLELK